jgi:hypothetical protein
MFQTSFFHDPVEGFLGRLGCISVACFHQDFWGKEIPYLSFLHDASANTLEKGT